MLSKNDIKRIRSLRQNKFRKELDLFIAEGVKVVSELAESEFEISKLYATESMSLGIDEELISAKELQQISVLKNPNQCLAIVRRPHWKLNMADLKDELVLVLDEIRDPGNLGTIIRIADWFAIRHIICAPGSVDPFNPKVVQATMGSLSRVAIHEVDLTSFIKDYREQYPEAGVWAAALGGTPLSSAVLNPSGLVIIGSESHGISDAVLDLATEKIAIEGYGKAESLNAGIATGIICHEFRKQGN